MTTTVTIYFLGKYRPAHFQASTLAIAVQRAETSLHNIADRHWFLTRLREGERAMRSPHYTSWSCDHCDRGVSIIDRPHDPWLDSLTAKLPLCPGLDYRAAV